MSQEQGFDIASNPEFQQMKETQDQMAQIMVQQNQQNEENEADAELEREFEDLHEKHGDFDEGYVLSQMMSGAEPEEAVEAYNEFVNRIRSEEKRPPTVMGEGGSVTSSNVDPSKLDSKGRKAMIQDMLSRHAQER